MRLVRYFLLFTVLITYSSTYAQVSSSATTAQSNLQAGLFYSLDANLSADNLVINQNGIIGYNTEYNRPNFTAGLNLQYAVTKKLALLSGLSYSNKQLTGTYYCGSCLFVKEPQPEKIDIQLVQVPATLKYYPYAQKFGIFGEIGVLNQFMVEKPNQNSSQLDGRTYSLSGLAGVGVEYHWGPNITAEISARYTNGLTPLFERADYSYQTFGVQLSLFTKL